MNNKYTKITGMFIAISVIIWTFYDVWVISAGGKDASISQVLINYFYEYPIGTFAFGVVVGHLVWRMPDKYKVTPQEFSIIEERRKLK